MAGLARHERPGRIADRFDVVARIEEGDDAAGTSFEALVAPRERADQRPLVEHELDVAAEVLGVQQSLLERPAVERKHVGDHAPPRSLVSVFEGAEELSRSLAMELAELRGNI